MKIATWNIERLQKKKNIDAIKRIVEEIDADIFIFTEFDTVLELPSYEFKIETDRLSREPYHYFETERRVAIFSKFPVLQTFETYDSQTSCCAEFKTESGSLIVYGTITGITGKSDKNFKSDLECQILDIKRFSQLGNFCFAGDLNTSFSDNYYFTHFARERFKKCFHINKLLNTTEDIVHNIDHIILSKSFANQFSLSISEWNTDFQLSDHKGILLELIKK